jgi:hypothetical protein
MGLKLNGTYQLVAYDDMNLLGDNIDHVNKFALTLFEARTEVGLKINVENTKYMLLSHSQHAGQNRDSSCSTYGIDSHRIWGEKANWKILK